jgi:hypothetical protein
MTLPRPPWVGAVIRAGAVPAHSVPAASVGRLELDPAPASAELVEDETLRAHRLGPGFRPAAAAFLDGIEHWRVVAYDGVTPIGRAYVAAAVRRRAGNRRLITMIRDDRDFVATRITALTPAVRRELEQSGAEIVDVTGPIAAQPGGALEAIRRAVERVRVELERGVAERYVNRLAPDEWLVVDGVLSESARLAEHPRTLGIVKSHSAQYFTACCGWRRARTRTPFRALRRSEDGCSPSAPRYRPLTRAGTVCCILYTTWRPT